MASQADKIRDFILREVPDHSREIIRLAAEEFGISRQAVSYHVRKLTDEGTLTASGRTSARTYALTHDVTRRTFELSKRLEEHVVWRDFVSSELHDLPDNTRSICQYGITEMINNAVDHSDGSTLEVVIDRTAVGVELTVADDGIGIFRRIQEHLELPYPRDAVLELTKGKFTTDPQHHTGEGIFFTSRMFDEFALTANELELVHVSEGGDWFIEGADSGDGTTVRLAIERSTEHTAAGVFDDFTSPDTDGAAFDVTHVPIGLATYGDENLISRSQARRVLMRCNLFQRVILDFRGVSGIGRAFADELFRVFPLEYPDVELIPVHTNPEVASVIAGIRGPEAADTVSEDPGG
jgi:anti-sigma regulatory factor (Ser/Thr protein kinase)